MAKNAGVIMTDAGVKVIEYNAFRNCSTLKVVEIPSTVTKINTLAFAYCTDKDTINR